VGWFDPVTTDYDEWVKIHRKGNVVVIGYCSVKEFLSNYSPQDSKPSLSIDFIEQKL
jgi:hypothetical protein